MWICSECKQSHQDQFDECWICSGTDVSDRKAAESSAVQEPVLPTLVLPDYSYFSLPLLICGMLIWMGLREVAVEHQDPRFPVLSVGDIVMLVIAGLLYYVPVVFVLLRYGILSTIRRTPRDFNSRDCFASLGQILKLPTHISDSWPWFQYVYYGSFLVLIAIPAIIHFFFWLDP